MSVAEVLPAIDAAPFLPFREPILITPDGDAWIPHAFRLKLISLQHICQGISLSWAPVPEVGKALLVIAGGNSDAPTDESVAAFVSRVELRSLIGDLQSIDDQMGDAL